MATALYVVVVFAAFIVPLREPPALGLFVAFMAASSFRMVPVQALSSRVPEPEQRARFMSVQSVVQHLGSATGALLASKMLRQLPGGALGGMGVVASLAVLLATAVPGLLWAVEQRIRRRERSVERAFAGSRGAPARVT